MTIESKLGGGSVSSESEGVQVEKAGEGPVAMD